MNFLHISYIHASHLCSHSDVSLSFPNVEPSVFWSTEMTANPNQHWGGKNHTSVARIVTRIAALHSVLFHFTYQVTSGYSISLIIRDPARGTSQLYLRVAWTYAFKQFFLFSFYGFTLPSIVCFFRIALSGGCFPCV